MRKRRNKTILILATIVSCSGLLGSAHAGVIESTVAVVNGDKITGLELRESLGLWGGGVSASGIPVKKKKEALDRLVAGRLLAQSARSKGLDNTEEFRTRLNQGEPRVLSSALFREKGASQVKITEDEIKAEVNRLRKADTGLSANDARTRAKSAVWESKMRKAQEDLVATARKEAPVTVYEEAVGKIGGSDTVADNAVLGTAGPETMTYGDVKKRLGQVSAQVAGKRGGMDLSNNPNAVRSVLDKELTQMALAVYGKRVIAEDSASMKAVRRELERSILVDMVTEREILKGAKATEKEIEEAYAKHSRMLVRDGKKIPLSEVKEEIRRIVQGEKRRKAMDTYVEKLKKKAKISIRDQMLPKI